MLRHWLHLRQAAMKPFFPVLLLALSWPFYQLVFLRWPSAGGANAVADANSRGQLAPMDVDRVPINDSIFFIESLNVTEFSGRSLCAYENAARKHPESNVYVIQSTDNAMTSAPGYLTEALPNLHFVTLDFSTFVLGSPLAPIWHEVVSTKNFRENISNTLRLLLVHRFGGTYLDNDMILLRPRPSEENCIVAQLLEQVNGAILQFRQGHMFPQLAMMVMASRFRGDVRNSQGPHLMTSIVETLCPFPKGTFLDERVCFENMKVLPPYVAYPLFFTKRNYYLEPKKMKSVRKEAFFSFAVHYWNHGLSDDFGNFTITADQPLYRLLAEGCPLTEQRSLKKMLGKTYLESY